MDTKYKPSSSDKNPTAERMAGVEAPTQMAAGEREALVERRGEATRALLLDENETLRRMVAARDEELVRVNWELERVYQGLNAVEGEVNRLRLENRRLTQENEVSQASVRLLALAAKGKAVLS